MNQALRSSVILILASLCLISSVGCGPTYKDTEVGQAIIDLCNKEYKIGEKYGADLQIGRTGRTLGIFITMPGELFDENMQITPEAGEMLGDILMAAARVILSSDARIDFCTIAARDERVPFLEVVFTRYIDDVKKLFYGAISRNDFFQRADMQLKSVEDQGGRFTLEPVRLEDFLAKQTAQRIKAAFLQEPLFLGVFDVRSVEGQYAYGTFKFTIDGAFVKESPANSDLVLARAMQITEGVMRSYKFDDFDVVVVANNASRESLSVDKNKLKRYRKWRAQ